MQNISTFLFLVLAACGGGASSIGNSCQQDAECGTLKCLRDKVSQAKMCVDAPGGGTCSPACATQADCRKYGARYSCALDQLFPECNPTGICRENYACSGTGCRIAPDN